MTSSDGTSEAAPEPPPDEAAPEPPPDDNDWLVTLPAQGERVDVGRNDLVGNSETSQDWLQVQSEDSPGHGDSPPEAHE